MADSAHSLANEVALYRRLTARWRRARRVRAAAARIRRGARGILILEWIAGGEDLDALHRRRARCSPGLAAALGRALAAVHAVARDDEALRDDAPWVLALHRPPLEALRYLSAAA